MKPKQVEFEIPRRAVPSYLGGILGDRHDPQSVKQNAFIPPGHRFLLYFHGMADKGQGEYQEGDKKRKDDLNEAKKRADWTTLKNSGATITADWVPLKDSKRQALSAAGGMGDVARSFLRNLKVRQEVLWAQERWQRSADLISPLATGLGNPHPVENGFAFLSPYGVPYIAGSGVKGVLRRAAEELAFFQEHSGWTLAHVWALFGFDENSACFSEDQESSDWLEAYRKWVVQVAQGNGGILDSWRQAINEQLPEKPVNWREKSSLELLKGMIGEVGKPLRRSIHWKGLLAFDDAFPDEKATLAVDILNPHHKTYYEGLSKENQEKGLPWPTPHDAENPVPVFFLTVAPGARFTFSARPLHGREALWKAIGDWKALLDAAFDHARDWLGFGAKTAVGYGAFEISASSDRGEGEKAAERGEPRCVWVDQTLAKIVAETHSKPDDALRGKRLAEAWREIQDAQLKQEALEDIRRRWEQKGWWSDPSGKAAKQAKAIYEGG